MSRAVIGSRAELVAALRAQLARLGPGPCHGGGCRCVAGALEERVRALREEMFLDALFLVAQVPGGQVAEAEKCCYAFDVRLCAGLCRATWAEEAFWSGLVRVQHPGPDKRTRLMYAAWRGDAARVRWLLARGAPREPKDVDGWTALHYASFQSNLKPVRALLAAGADASAVTFIGLTPLHLASEYGRKNIVRALLTAGASVNAATSTGCTPLYFAAQNGCADTVGALLAAGANVDAVARDGTPLYAAARNGHADAVRALLAAGANINAAAAGGCTPLHVAVYQCHTSIVCTLLAAGAHVDAADRDGATALWTASELGFTDIVRKLLAAGANIEAAQNGHGFYDGWRPLHAASGYGHVSVMEVLAEAGADKSALTADGRNALELFGKEVERQIGTSRGALVRRRSIAAHTQCLRGAEP